MIRLVTFILLLQLASTSTSSSNTLTHRTLHHFEPTRASAPLHRHETLQQQQAQAQHPILNRPPSFLLSSSHATVTRLHHAHRISAATVETLTFTHTFDANKKQKENALLLSVPNSIDFSSSNSATRRIGEWMSHPQLHRLVSLKCGVAIVPYCDESEEAEENEEDENTKLDEIDWMNARFDRPCMIPFVRIENDTIHQDDATSLTRITGVSMLLFLPHAAASSSSHPSPHHHSIHTSHVGLLAARSTDYRNRKCSMTLDNDFVLDHPEEQHLQWIDADVGVEQQQPEDFPPRTFHDFTPSRRTHNTSQQQQQPSHDYSIWSHASASSVLTQVYHDFQVNLVKRGMTRKQRKGGQKADDDKTMDRDESMPLEDDPTSNSTIFLDLDTTFSSSAKTSALSRFHLEELAETNTIYRLMNDLQSATHSGASATIVWELVLRPALNILRKTLLKSFRTEMSTKLIKGLAKLTKGAVKMGGPPSDDSKYTKPPVWTVEDPEKLWKSTPAEMPSPVVKKAQQGSDFGVVYAEDGGAKSLLEVTNRAFLSSEHTVGVRGIVDPLLKFLTPVLHNTVTQSVHDMTEKGLTKSIDLYTLEPMKKQLFTVIHKDSVKMLSKQLIEQVTKHVSEHLIKTLPNPLTVLSTQAIHKALVRPLTYTLSSSLTYSLTRSPQQDEECAQCTSDSLSCSACYVTKSNDHYVVYYTNYYTRYFEEYYTFYYTEYYAKLFAMDQVKRMEVEEEGGKK